MAAGAARTPLASIPAGYADKCAGILLGCMVGDALGAPIEGQSRADLQRTNKDEAGAWKLTEFVAGVAMGTREVRYAMYTDDTQSTLALADALVSGPFDARQIAKNYAAFYQHKPTAVLRKVESEEDGYRMSGRMCFQDGSFANGAAMRIAPLGAVFRNASDEVFREAVRLAVVSSHVNAEAIDGAVLIAKAVAMLCKMAPAQFSPIAFLAALEVHARTPVIKERLAYLQQQMQDIERKVEVSDDIVLKRICDIKTRDAVPCALWAMARYGNDPRLCIIEAVNLGGDADTVGAMAGAMVGALHGAKWLPSVWDSELENETYGRDYALKLGIQLANLDVTSIPQNPQNRVPP